MPDGRRDPFFGRPCNMILSFYMYGSKTSNSNRNAVTAAEDQEPLLETANRGFEAWYYKGAQNPSLTMKARY